MEPIISPFFIYLLSIIDTIKGISGVIGGLCFIALTVSIIAMWVLKHADEHTFCDEDAWKLTWKTVKHYTLLPAILCLTLTIFAPSRNILIAMYVSNYITTDNVTKAIEASGNFKDVIKKDIIEIIEAMKGEKAQSEKSKDNN